MTSYVNTIEGELSHIISTSNTNLEGELSHIISTSNSEMTNYVNTIEGELSHIISTSNTNLEGELSHIISTSNSEMTNYVNTIEGELSHIISTSNTNLEGELSHIISTSNSEMTNYVNTIEGELSHIISTSNNDMSSRVDDLDSITDFIEKISSIHTKFNSDITLNGKLITNDLEVIGGATRINTVTYETENLEIINTQSDGSSLNIVQNNDSYNVIQTSNLINDKIFIIDKNSYVGINKQPTLELDVNGSIQFNGTLNGINTTTLELYINIIK